MVDPSPPVAPPSAAVRAYPRSSRGARQHTSIRGRPRVVRAPPFAAASTPFARASARLRPPAHPCAPPPVHDRPSACCRRPAALHRPLRPDYRSSDDHDTLIGGFVSSAAGGHGCCSSPSNTSTTWGTPCDACAYAVLFAVASNQAAHHHLWRVDGLRLCIHSSRTSCLEGVG